MDTYTDWMATALDLKDRLNIAIDALEFMTKPITSSTGEISVAELLEMVEQDYNKGKKALYLIRKGLDHDDI